MKTILVVIMMLFSPIVLGAMTSEDWYYEEYFPIGGNLRYDAWTQTSNLRTFVTSCKVDNRAGDPELRFFVATNEAINARGAKIEVQFRFGNKIFKLPAMVSTVNTTNVYIYPESSRKSEIIRLMREGVRFTIRIPTVVNAVDIRQTFSLMGFTDASLGLRKICSL